MKFGIIFPEIKINNDLICDGHHRYISSLLADIKIQTIPSNHNSESIIYNWDSMLFDEEDWDTPSLIIHYNERDAIYNNLDLERLNDMLK